jgi:hypothetical protein
MIRIFACGHVAGIGWSEVMGNGLKRVRALCFAMMTDTQGGHTARKPHLALTTIAALGIVF